MNGCAWRERLLEAEPAELTGDDATELGRHVASCAACRSDAERILTAHAALGGWLDEAPQLDAAALVARARAEIGGAGDAGGPRGAADRAGRRPLAVAWIPLAAAAALAALLLRGPTEPEPLPGTAPAALAPADVSAPEGVNFAVLPTADPDITVVWIFQGEG